MQELHLHKRPVPDLDWSPDNLLLASAAEDGGVCLWRAENGQLVCLKLLHLCIRAFCCNSQPVAPNATAARDVAILAVCKESADKPSFHKCTFIASGRQTTAHSPAAPLPPAELFHQCQVPALHRALTAGSMQWDLTLFLDEHCMALTASECVSGCMQMRTFMLGSGATCCRFLHANANFLVVGTAAGELHILNSSTARTQVLPVASHSASIDVRQWELLIAIESLMTDL